MLKKITSLLTISSLGLSFISCNKIDEGSKAAPEQSSETRAKWEEMKEALRLPDNFGPNLYTTGAKELMAEYNQVLSESTTRLTQNTWASRCAAIDKLEKHPYLKAKNASGLDIDADIYVMTYRLQKNKQGDPESQARTGLMTVPRKAADAANPSYPIMMYGHGGDTGLEYKEIASVLSDLQTSYMILAPTFPGEPLLDVDHEKTVGKSIPWKNDVDEFLGMHDCIVNYNQHQVYTQLAPLMGGSFTPDASFDSMVIKTTEEVRTVLNPMLIGPGVPDVSPFTLNLQTYKNYFNFPATSVAVGSSRGGLVASLALAKIGAMINVLKGTQVTDASGAKISLLDGFLNRKMPFQFANEMGKALNADKFGFSFPMFTGLSTIGAPSSVTIGSFQVVLEQVVRGNGETTVAKHRPGIRKLLHIFDEYLDGSRSVDDAKYEIILRDLTYLAPLSIAALKNWDMPLLPGSALLMHGTGDKTVPDEQTQAAANVLIGMANDKTVRSQTLSPLGLNITTRMFEKNMSLSDCDEKDSFHVNKCFFQSHAKLPEAFFDANLALRWLHPEADVHSLMYGYLLYTTFKTESYNPVYTEMKPFLVSMLDPELMTKIDTIYQETGAAGITKASEKIKETMKRFKAEHLKDVQKTGQAFLAKHRSENLKTIGEKIFKNNADFSDEYLADLFKLSSRDDLLAYYKENREHQFAIETMLANGQLDFSGDFQPLMSWKGMKAVKVTKGYLHSEKKTPLQFLNKWATDFTRAPQF